MNCANCATSESVGYIYIYIIYVYITAMMASVETHLRRLAYDVAVFVSEKAEEDKFPAT